MNLKKEINQKMGNIPTFLLVPIIIVNTLIPLIIFVSISWNWFEFKLIGLACVVLFWLWIGIELRLLSSIISQEKHTPEDMINSLPKLFSVAWMGWLSFTWLTLLLLDKQPKPGK